MTSKRATDIAARYLPIPTDYSAALAADIDAYVEECIAEGVRVTKNWGDEYDKISRENMSLRGQYVKVLARMERMSRRFAATAMLLCVVIVALCGVIIWRAM